MDQGMARISSKMQDLQIKNQIAEENTKALQLKGREVGLPLMAAKGEKGHSGSETVEVVTNVYGMVPRGQRIYRYDISIKGIVEGRNGSGVHDLMRARGDTRIVERRYMRPKVFRSLREQFPVVVGRGTLIYDAGAILYANERLNMPREGGEFVVTGLDPVVFPSFNSALVVITPPADGEIELSVDDVRASIDPDLDQTNLELIQFLDILTSHPAMVDGEDFFGYSSSELYLESPFDHGFTADDLPNYGRNQSHLEVGCRKATRFVEGPGGKGYVHPAEVISLHKRDFFDDCPLLARMQLHVGDIRLDEHTLTTLNDKLIGLWVETTHKPKRQVFQIHQFVIDCPRTKLFQRNGQETTVENYFRNQYGIEVQPNLPLVEAVFNDRELYFPPEVLKTAIYQRIPLMRQDRDVEPEMIKAMAIPPARRSEQEVRLKNLLRLDNNATLTAGGVNFISERLVVADARMLDAPAIHFMDSTQQPMAKSGMTWDAGKYVRPTELSRWSIIALCSLDENIGEDELRACVECLIAHANARGMVIAPPQRIEVTNYAENKVREFLVAAKGRIDEFVLVVHPSAAAGDVAHGKMKVWERVQGIATQGILIKTVKQSNLEGKPVTLGNVLAKTNVKMGGLNYRIKSEIVKERDLIIGIGASHPRIKDVQIGNPVNGGPVINGPNGNQPARGNGINGGNGANGYFMNGKFNGRANGRRFRSKRFPPSVIGYSANVHPSKDPYEFIGDYYLQEARRDEKPELIARIVQICAGKFRQARGYNPERILIYRNGTAEGQWSGILKFEVPNIEMVLEEMGILVDPVIVVPSKQHRLRFYPSEIPTEQAPPEQNIKPGTVIDSTVVHPVYSQFFLNSHRALQGTAKTPCYTTIYNPIKMSNDELQLFSNVLAFGHQIVNSPTSLPTPVYVAEEYAKRGLNLFAEWYFEGLVPPERIEVMSLQEIERHITYESSTVFVSRRINA